MCRTFALRNVPVEGEVNSQVFSIPGRNTPNAAPRQRTFDFQAGDMGYVPFAIEHYIENIGKESVRFLEMFAKDRFAELCLEQWMALTAPEIIRPHLKLGDKAMTSLSKKKQPAVKSS
jgi:oxalate decarboxylase